MRNICTPAEEILWQRLKVKQLLGYDFHRQKPLLYFIVDFYCHELNLAIEIDGNIHSLENVKYRDTNRQELLEEFGITFLRFKNEEVLSNCEELVARMEDWIIDFRKSSRHTPYFPLSRG